MFLRTKDYYKQIAKATLDQVLKEAVGISGDTEILEFSESTAIEDIKSRISGRYRTDDVFKSFRDFDISLDYYYGDRINITADDYSNAVTYQVGERVLYQSTVYECILLSLAHLPTNPTYWEIIGEEGMYYIPFPQKWDDRVSYAIDDLVNKDYIVYKRLDFAGHTNGIVVTDTNYWEVINTIDYTPVNGKFPYETAWTMGDNRNLTIVKCVIDIVLYDIHSIINPRNIPALRKDRYDSVMIFLDNVVNGKMNLDLIQYNAQQGYKLRAGSNQKFNSTY